MIMKLRKSYYWPNTKNDAANYLARCIECQKLTTEHQHPAGLQQPLPIRKWNWEIISMDFVMGLPKTNKEHDSIMVVVDKLSKVAHFIPIKSTNKVINIADIFMK